LIAVEALLVDFEVRAVQKVGRKIFDRKTDGLRGLIKPPGGITSSGGKVPSVTRPSPARPAMTSKT